MKRFIVNQNDLDNVLSLNKTVHLDLLKEDKNTLLYNSLKIKKDDVFYFSPNTNLKEKIFCKVISLQYLKLEEVLDQDIEKSGIYKSCWPESYESDPDTGYFSFTSYASGLLHFLYNKHKVDYSDLNPKLFVIEFEKNIYNK